MDYANKKNVSNKTYHSVLCKKKRLAWFDQFVTSAVFTKHSFSDLSFYSFSFFLPSSLAM